MKVLFEVKRLEEAQPGSGNFYWKDYSKIIEIFDPADIMKTYRTAFDPDTKFFSYLPECGCAKW